MVFQSIKFKMQNLTSILLSVCIAAGLTVASDYEGLFNKIDACKTSTERLMCNKCEEFQLGMTEEECCTTEVGFNVCEICAEDIDDCLALRNEFFSGLIEKREEKRKRFGRLFFNKRYGTVFFGGRGSKAKREVKKSS